MVCGDVLSSFFFYLTYFLWGGTNRKAGLSIKLNFDWAFVVKVIGETGLEKINNCTNGIVRKVSTSPTHRTGICVIQTL